MDLLLAIFANEHPNGLFATGSIPVFKGEYVHSDRITNWLRSLKDKYALKPNLYSGTSFAYNNHTWDMCARDNGVDILYDSKLIKHIEDPQDKSATEAVNEEKTTIDPNDFAPKAEPKYHVGDWLASFDLQPVQIISIKMNAYEMSSGAIDPIYMVDNNPNIRLWTINDAKPGDIIYAESKYNTFDFIKIFAKLDNNNNFWGYCDVGRDCYDNYREFDGDKGFVALDRYNFYPATKEQRDILFSKMKEAGYVWDDENKRLKLDMSGMLETKY